MPKSILYWQPSCRRRASDQRFQSRCEEERSVCALRFRGAFAFFLTASALVTSQSSPNAQSAGDLPVLVVVRHANKAPEPADDPPLTSSGVKRAQDLATALRSAGVTGIITTQLRRTR